MPTYEYQCEKCQRLFEVRQRITEPALTTCEVCGGHVKRLLSSAPFILKGEGWYVTDYPSESRKKAKESESKADKPAEKPAATTGGDGAASSSTSSSATGSSATGGASPSAPAKSD